MRDARPLTFTCGVISALAIAMVATLGVPLVAQQDEAALRAQVEAFQQSLKSAWDAGDRDAVLTHFQHADVLPPTSAQYSMLGRFPFWDRPVASVTRNADGTLEAEFLMDPGSESQAVVAARPTFESELFPIFEDGFWKQVEQQAAAAGQALTQEMRDSFQFRPLGEIHVTDKAVLLLLVGFQGEGEMNPMGAAFLRKGNDWEFDATRAMQRQSSVEEFLGDDAGRRIGRAPGLTVEQLPGIYEHSRTTLREQYEAAEDAGDTGRLMDLAEQAMAGRPLLKMWDAVSSLRYSPSDPAPVRLGKQQLDGSEGLILIEVLDEDGDVDERVPLKVAREADGWVIVGPYETPSDRTRQLFDDLGYALRDFKDANGSYPKIADLDELLTVLTPFAEQRELRSVDAWGHAFHYVVSDDGQTYRLISPGADQKFDHGDWDPTPERIRDQQSTDVNSDIVHENGRFGRVHVRGIW